MSHKIEYPLIYMPNVWHVGDLSKPKTVSPHRSEISQTGPGLSVSLSPEEWKQFLKLGGFDTWRLSRHAAAFLDASALSDRDVEQIINWCVENGFVSIKTAWKTSYFNEDIEANVDILNETKDQAIAESMLFNEDENITEVNIPVITKKGLNTFSRKLKKETYFFDATDFCISIWSNLILSKEIKDLVGVWWHKNSFLEDDISEGIIFPSKINKFSKSKEIRIVEDLSDEINETVWVGRNTKPNKYNFITNCINSDGESISKMISHSNSIDIEFSQFSKLMGMNKSDCRKFLHNIINCGYSEKNKFTIDRDYHVRFHASVYKNYPCLYLVHSAIEYVFQNHENFDPYLDIGYKTNNEADDIDYGFDMEG